MNESLIALSIAYVFVVVMVLMALIRSQISPFLKVVLLIISIGLYWISFHGWQESQGWPSSTNLPEKFLLHHSLVHEPNPENDDQGEIILWVSAVKDMVIARQPRAYTLGYSKDLHGRVERATEEVKNGSQQIGQRIVNEDMQGQENNSALFTSGIESVEFSTLPDPILPDK